MSRQYRAGSHESQWNEMMIKDIPADAMWANISRFPGMAVPHDVHLPSHSMFPWLQAASTPQVAAPPNRRAVTTSQHVTPSTYVHDQARSDAHANMLFRDPLRTSQFASAAASTRTHDPNSQFNTRTSVAAKQFRVPSPHLPQTSHDTLQLQQQYLRSLSTQSDVAMGVHPDMFRHRQVQMQAHQQPQQRADDIFSSLSGHPFITDDRLRYQQQLVASQRQTTDVFGHQTAATAVAAATRNNMLQSLLKPQQHEQARPVAEAVRRSSSCDAGSSRQMTLPTDPLIRPTTHDASLRLLQQTSDSISHCQPLPVDALKHAVVSTQHRMSALPDHFLHLDQSLHNEDWSSCRYQPDLRQRQPPDPNVGVIQQNQTLPMTVVKQPTMQRLPPPSPDVIEITPRQTTPTHPPKASPIGGFSLTKPSISPAGGAQQRVPSLSPSGAATRMPTTSPAQRLTSPHQASISPYHKAVPSPATTAPQPQLTPSPFTHPSQPTVAAEYSPVSPATGRNMTPFKSPRRPTTPTDISKEVTPPLSQESSILPSVHDDISSDDDNIDDDLPSDSGSDATIPAMDSSYKSPVTEAARKVEAPRKRMPARQPPSDYSLSNSDIEADTDVASPNASISEPEIESEPEIKDKPPPIPTYSRVPSKMSSMRNRLAASSSSSSSDSSSTSDLDEIQPYNRKANLSKKSTSTLNKSSLAFLSDTSSDNEFVSKNHASKKVSTGKSAKSTLVSHSGGKKSTFHKTKPEVTNKNKRSKKSPKEGVSCENPKKKSDVEMKTNNTDKDAKTKRKEKEDKFVNSNLVSWDLSSILEMSVPPRKAFRKAEEKLRKSNELERESRNKDDDYIPSKKVSSHKPSYVERSPSPLPKPSHIKGKNSPSTSALSRGDRFPLKRKLSSSGGKVLSPVLMKHKKMDAKHHRRDHQHKSSTSDLVPRHIAKHKHSSGPPKESLSWGLASIHHIDPKKKEKNFPVSSDNSDDVDNLSSDSPDELRPNVGCPSPATQHSSPFLRRKQVEPAKSLNKPAKSPTRAPPKTSKTPKSPTRSTGRSPRPIVKRSPGQLSGKSPGRASGKSPGRASGKSPGRASGKSPGRASGRSPGRASGKSPGRASGRSPGRASGKSPGRASGRSPGRASGKSPGRASGRSPGRASGRSPGRASGKSPGRASGKSPGRVSGRSPLTANKSPSMTVDRSPTYTSSRSPRRLQRKSPLVYKSPGSPYEKHGSFPSDSDSDSDLMDTAQPSPWNLASAIQRMQQEKGGKDHSPRSRNKWKKSFSEIGGESSPEQTDPFYGKSAEEKFNDVLESEEKEESRALDSSRKDAWLKSIEEFTKEERDKPPPKRKTKRTSQKQHKDKFDDRQIWMKPKPDDLLNPDEELNNAVSGLLGAIGGEDDHVFIPSDSEKVSHTTDAESRPKSRDAISVDSDYHRKHADAVSDHRKHSEIALDYRKHSDILSDRSKHSDMPLDYRKHNDVPSEHRKHNDMTWDHRNMRINASLDYCKRADGATDFPNSSQATLNYRKRSDVSPDTMTNDSKVKVSDVFAPDRESRSKAKEQLADKSKSQSASKERSSCKIKQGVKTKEHDIYNVELHQPTDAHSAGKIKQGVKTKEHDLYNVELHQPTEARSAGKIKQGVKTKEHDLYNVGLHQPTEAHSTGKIKQGVKTKEHDLYNVGLHQPTEAHSTGKIKQGVKTKEHDLYNVGLHQPTEAHSAGKIKQGVKTKEHDLYNVGLHQPTEAHSAGKIKQGVKTKEHDSYNVELHQPTNAHSAAKIKPGVKTNEHTLDKTELHSRSREHATDEDELRLREIDLRHSDKSKLQMKPSDLQMPENELLSVIKERVFEKNRSRSRTNDCGFEKSENRSSYNDRILDKSDSRSGYNEFLLDKTDVHQKGSEQSLEKPTLRSKTNDSIFDKNVSKLFKDDSFSFDSEPILMNDPKKRGKKAVSVYAPVTSPPLLLLAMTSSAKPSVASGSMPSLAMSTAITSGTFSFNLTSQSVIQSNVITKPNQMQSLIADAPRMTASANQQNYLGAGFGGVSSHLSGHLLNPPMMSHIVGPRTANITATITSLPGPSVITSVMLTPPLSSKPVAETHLSGASPGLSPSISPAAFSAPTTDEMSMWPAKKKLLKRSTDDIALKAALDHAELGSVETQLGLQALDFSKESASSPSVKKSPQRGVKGKAGRGRTKASLKQMPDDLLLPGSTFNCVAEGGLDMRYKKLEGHTGIDVSSPYLQPQSTPVIEFTKPHDTPTSPSLSLTTVSCYNPVTPIMSSSLASYMDLPIMAPFPMPLSMSSMTTQPSVITSLSDTSMYHTSPGHVITSKSHPQTEEPLLAQQNTMPPADLQKRTQNAPMAFPQLAVITNEERGVHAGPEQTQKFFQAVLTRGKEVGIPHAITAIKRLGKDDCAKRGKPTPKGRGRSTCKSLKFGTSMAKPLDGPEAAKIKRKLNPRARNVDVYEFKDDDFDSFVMNPISTSHEVPTAPFIASTNTGLMNVSETATLPGDGKLPSSTAISSSTDLATTTSSIPESVCTTLKPSPHHLVKTKAALKQTVPEFDKILTEYCTPDELVAAANDRGVTAMEPKVGKSPVTRGRGRVAATVKVLRKGLRSGLRSSLRLNPSLSEEDESSAADVYEPLSDSDDIPLKLSAKTLSSRAEQDSNQTSTDLGKSVATLMPTDVSSVHPSEGVLEDHGFATKKGNSVGQSEKSVHQTDKAAHQGDKSVIQNVKVVNQGDKSVNQICKIVNESDKSVNRNKRAVDKDDKVDNQNDKAVSQNGEAMNTIVKALKLSIKTVNQSDKTTVDADNGDVGLTYTPIRVVTNSTPTTNTDDKSMCDDSKLHADPSKKSPIEEIENEPILSRIGQGGSVAAVSPPTNHPKKRKVPVRKAMMKLRKSSLDESGDGSEKIEGSAEPAKKDDTCELDQPTLSGDPGGAVPDFVQPRNPPTKRKLKGKRGRGRKKIRPNSPLVAPSRANSLADVSDVDTMRKSGLNSVSGSVEGKLIDSELPASTFDTAIDDSSKNDAEKIDESITGLDNNDSSDVDEVTASKVDADNVVEEPKPDDELRKGKLVLRVNANVLEKLHPNLATNSLKSSLPKTETDTLTVKMDAIAQTQPAMLLKSLYPLVPPTPEYETAYETETDMEMQREKFSCIFTSGINLRIRRVGTPINSDEEDDFLDAPAMVYSEPSVPNPKVFSIGGLNNAVKSTSKNGDEDLSKGDSKSFCRTSPVASNPMMLLHAKNILAGSSAPATNTPVTIGVAVEEKSALKSGVPVKMFKCCKCEYKSVECGDLVKHFDLIHVKNDPILIGKLPELNASLSETVVVKDTVMSTEVIPVVDAVVSNSKENVIAKEKELIAAKEAFDVKHPTIPKELRCPICKQTLPSESLAKSHFQKSHNIKVDSDECKAVLTGNELEDAYKLRQIEAETDVESLSKALNISKMNVRLCFYQKRKHDKSIVLSSESQSESISNNSKTKESPNSFKKPELTPSTSKPKSKKGKKGRKTIEDPSKKFTPYQLSVLRDFSDQSLWWKRGRITEICEITKLTSRDVEDWFVLQRRKVNSTKDVAEEPPSHTDTVSDGDAKQTETTEDGIDHIERARLRELDREHKTWVGLYLESSYQKNKTLSNQETDVISKVSGLSPHTIEYWFQKRQNRDTELISQFSKSPTGKAKQLKGKPMSEDSGPTLLGDHTYTTPTLKDTAMATKVKVLLSKDAILNATAAMLSKVETKSTSRAESPLFSAEVSDESNDATSSSVSGDSSNVAPFRVQSDETFLSRGMKFAKTAINRKAAHSPVPAEEPGTMPIEEKVASPRSGHKEPRKSGLNRRRLSSVESTIVDWSVVTQDFVDNHGNSILTCAYCCLALANRESYRMHLMEYHQNRLIFLCSMCSNKEATCLYTAKQHLLDKHKVCESGFKRWILTDLVDSDYTCPECKLKCRSPSLLRDHILKEHRSNKLFQCSLCSPWQEALYYVDVYKHIMDLHRLPEATVVSSMITPAESLLDLTHSAMANNELPMVAQKIRPSTELVDATFATLLEDDALVQKSDFSPSVSPISIPDLSLFDDLPLCFPDDMPQHCAKQDNSSLILEVNEEQMERNTHSAGSDIGVAPDKLRISKVEAAILAGISLAARYDVGQHESPLSREYAVKGFVNELIGDVGDKMSRKEELMDCRKQCVHFLSWVYSNVETRLQTPAQRFVNQILSNVDDILMKRYTNIKWHREFKMSCETHEFVGETDCQMQTHHPIAITSLNKKSCSDHNRSDGEIDLFTMASKYDLNVFECGTCYDVFPKATLLESHLEYCRPQAGGQSSMSVYVPDSFVRSYITSKLGDLSSTGDFTCSICAAAFHGNLVVMLTHLSTHTRPVFTLHPARNPRVSSNTIRHLDYNPWLKTSNQEIDLHTVEKEEAWRRQNQEEEARLTRLANRKGKRKKKPTRAYVPSKKKKVNLDISVDNEVCRVRQVSSADKSEQAVDPLLLNMNQSMHRLMTVAPMSAQPKKKVDNMLWSPSKMVTRTSVQQRQQRHEDSPRKRMLLSTTTHSKHKDSLREVVEDPTKTSRFPEKYDSMSIHLAHSDYIILLSLIREKSDKSFCKSKLDLLDKLQVGKSREACPGDGCTIAQCPCCKVCTLPYSAVRLLYLELCTTKKTKMFVYVYFSHYVCYYCNVKLTDDDKLLSHLETHMDITCLDSDGAGREKPDPSDCRSSP